MKKLLSILMAVCLIAALFTACGSGGSTDNSGNTGAVSANPDNLATSFDGLDNVAFVLIYNPDTYDEKSENNEKRQTGNVGDYINPSLDRGEEDRNPNLSTFSQGRFDEELSKIKVDLSGSRASVDQPSFNVGDTKEFFYENSGIKKDTFTCSYVGDKCCIWIVNGEDVDESAAEALANEFDTVIYDKDIELFGTPRYADVGGKVHLLFHPMEEGYGGYFRPLDLFSSEEATQEEAEEFGANLDLAIVHINSLLTSAEYEELLNSTVAHEFQHLINFTDYIDYNQKSFTSTWLNEAMSGYAEEKIYPGIQLKDGRFDDYSSSTMVRHGQSLYNFNNDYPDIGVYGSVYLYSQYLENLCGEGIFKSIHDYWRSPTSTFTDSASLHSSVPSDVASAIESKYNYADSISFASDDDEWMSKLTLDFYMSMMKFDEDDPQAYENLQAQTLLYDEINPADIEGGGRVIVSTKSGQFQVPDDADNPLVYVGFDKDFNQITTAIIK